MAVMGARSVSRVQWQDRLRAASLMLFHGAQPEDVARLTRLPREVIEGLDNRTKPTETQAGPIRGGRSPWRTDEPTR